MKVAVITYMHRREEMFKLHANCVKRLAEKYDVIPIVVNSIEYPAKKLVESYGFEYHEHPNKVPQQYWLGTKANFAVICASCHNPDYVMVLDSDDIISDSFFEMFLEQMKLGIDVIGVRDLYFWSLHTKRSAFNVFGYYQGRGTRITGVGKTMSRNILEKVDWCPFNRKVNSGLDGTMLAKTRKRGATKVSLIQKEHDVFGIDIKSGGNINGIGNFPVVKMNPEKTLRKYLPEWEVEQIMGFAEKNWKERYGSDWVNLSKSQIQ